MADKSSIEWTEATWNPDDRLRPRHRRLRQLLRADAGQAPQGHGRREVPERRRPADLRPRLRRHGAPERAGPARAGGARRKVVFVNSMSDLFHAQVPLGFVREVFDVMRRDAAAHLPGAHEARAAAALRVADQLDWPATSGWASPSRRRRRWTASTTCGRCRPRCASCRASRCSGRSPASTSTASTGSSPAASPGREHRPMDPAWVARHPRAVHRRPTCRSSSSSGAAARRRRRPRARRPDVGRDAGPGQRLGRGTPPRPSGKA